ncbi:NAD-binding protein, partial [Myxococcota bacterium]|nr:NAD-binding protein [Myxococcota bacterium]
DLGVVMESPALILGALFAVLTLKGAVLVVLGRAWGVAKDQTAIFAAALAGVGEFAFVLLGFAAREGVLTLEQTTPLVAVTALSMAATPLLLLAVERLVLPRLVAVAPPARESDVEDHGRPVIIAGYGRFGQIAGRFLTASGVGTTTVDVDGDQIDMLRRFGQRVYYGDASRLDLLTAAGAARAQLLIVAVDDHEKAMQIVHLAQKHFPGLAILARARGRAEAYDLMEAKVEGVYRETFDTALRVGVDALRLLGQSSHRAHRAGLAFRRVDERSLVEMAAVRHDQERLMRTARERVALLERTLAADQERESVLHEDGWDSDVLRAGRPPERPAEP